MHIPDGYLSLETVVVSYGLALPLWVYGFKKLKAALNEETLPLIGALTALSFVIMMFNIPIPGGTSGHAVGAALIAILFDPWIAAIAVSLVLFIHLPTEASPPLRSTHWEWRLGVHLAGTISSNSLKGSGMHLLSPVGGLRSSPQLLSLRYLVFNLCSGVRTASLSISRSI